MNKDARDKRDEKQEQASFSLSLSSLLNHLSETAKKLNEARERWLNPEGASESELKKRTLMNLYNEREAGRCAWLNHLHRELDRAVLAIYGWTDLGEALFEAEDELDFNQEVLMQVPAEVLDELVRRLVGVVPPTRIILFGSAARGEMREASDLDVRVVVPDGLPQKESWNRAHAGMRHFGITTDLVVLNEGILAKYADTPGLVYEQAVREGKELYHAA